MNQQNMTNLQRIRQLERDLAAEIVVKEEEGHKETRVGDTTGDYPSRFYSGEEMWIIDKPRITKADTQKREAARQQLQKIYDNSKWYQVFVRGKIRSTLKRYEQLEQKPQSEPTGEDDEPFEPDRKFCEHSGRGY